VSRNGVGGPAAHAGPFYFRFLIRLAASAVVALPVLAGIESPALADDWIPPRAVTSMLPSATYAPSSTHALELVVRANGAPAGLNWTASSAGQFPLGIVPASGSLVIPADGIGTVSISVSLPDTALGIAVITVVLTHQAGGGRAARADAAVYAATGGRPEVRPVPGTWQAQAGTAGSVSFEIHSLSGQSETVVLTTGRHNPDPNNDGALFTGSAAPAEVLILAGGTVAVAAPTTLAPNAYAGSLNAVQLSVTSDGGISSSTGHALVASALSASLPTALYPVGLTPLDESAAGRDGAAYLPQRDYWLVPSGTSGVRALAAGSTDSIGSIDVNGNGSDDRWLGTIRIPAYAAALDVIPAFVAASGDTLDVGLLAAGREGLMLLDLRSVEDPPFGTWNDFYDVDGNGIDDRILRTIPTSGFATDVAWFRAPSGRVVALVADADTGSVPVSASYDPALTVAGTGMGIVAVDVGAALDSLGPVPYAAGTLATAGSALDLELRGGSAPTLAVADGAGGIAVYDLAAAGGAPATVTFTPRGTLALSSAWGTPYARDLAWVSNTKDSVYVAVAAGAGGVQLARVPASGAPTLVLVQQTASPAIGIAGAWTGTLAAALGSGGVALVQSPGGGQLHQVLSGAAAPYTAPVTLALGAAWAATGSALGVAAHQAWSSSATALRFKPTSGPIPDLLVSDGGRVLVLRPGQAQITAVEIEPTPPATYVTRLHVAPNPIERDGVFELRNEWVAGRGDGLAGGSAGPPMGQVRFEIYDVRGRLVRRITVPPASGAAFARAVWDGRDESGRHVSSGRYWVRARRSQSHEPSGSAAAAPILFVR